MSHLLQLTTLQPTDYDLFCNSYLSLMVRFRIPKEHHNSLLEILQGFFDDIDTVLIAIYDSQNAIAAIDFLTQYQEACKLIQSKHRQALNKDRISSNVNAIDSELNLQLQSRYLDTPIKLSYHGAARIAVEYIYNLLRKNDPVLRLKLHQFDNLPSNKELRTIRKSLQVNIDLGINKAIVDTVSELSNYIKSDSILTNALSRKQKLFIFELLYIADILKEIKQANNTIGLDFALPVNKVMKFKPNDRLADSKKVAFIEALVKNKGRMDRHNKSLMNSYRGE